MPTYCIRMEDTGERRELIITFAEMDKMRDENGVYTLEDGRTATRDYEAELAPSKQIKGAWPIHSNAMAVHPNQVRDAKEYARHRGVNVDFDGKGCPILDTPKHKEQYMKTRGVHDLGMSCDVKHSVR